MTARFAPLALAAVLSGCASDQGAALTDLDGSLAPLHSWFDAHAGTPRVIMLLSPA